MKRSSIAHQIEIDRLECAVLNHHVLIQSMKLDGFIQSQINEIKIKEKFLLEKIVAFVKNNYIEELGFQRLFETSSFAYITCSVKCESFYQFSCNELFLINFSEQAKEKGADFFDISFPEDFL